jgi:hypothetical protein
MNDPTDTITCKTTKAAFTYATCPNNSSLDGLEPRMMYSKQWRIRIEQLLDEAIVQAAIDMLEGKLPVAQLEHSSPQLTGVSTRKNEATFQSMNCICAPSVATTIEVLVMASNSLSRRNKRRIPGQPFNIIFRCCDFVFLLHHCLHAELLSVLCM